MFCLDLFRVDDVCTSIGGQLAELTILLYQNMFVDKVTTCKKWVGS